MLSIFFAIVFFGGTILLGRYVFGCWFNHIGLYGGIWMFTVVLYELKLILYPMVSDIAWSIIYATSIIYILGSLLVVSARFYAGKENNVFSMGDFFENRKDLLFADDGKSIRFFIVIFSLIGLAGAIQNWWVLIGKFGNITHVLAEANKIYHLRVKGEEIGIMPYVNLFAYSAVVLSGIYTAYKKKFTIYSIFPLLVVILKEIAMLGRANIFLAFLQFVFAFLLSRQYFFRKYRGTFSRTSMIIAVTIIFAIGTVGAVVVKQYRQVFENYSASGTLLRQLKDNPFISPSIYLYFSSNIGVFSKYYERLEETPPVGENTFLPVYNILSKFDMAAKPRVYPRGYFIPIWTNSATYLRDIHADFGDLGLCIVPFLLGWLTTFFWYKFHTEGRMLYLMLLVFSNVIICNTIFYMITRSVNWFASLIILLILIPLIERHNQSRFTQQN